MLWSLLFHQREHMYTDIDSCCSLPQWVYLMNPRKYALVDQSPIKVRIRGPKVKQSRWVVWKIVLICSEDVQSLLMCAKIKTMTSYTDCWADKSGESFSQWRIKISIACLLNTLSGESHAVGFSTMCSPKFSLFKQSINAEIFFTWKCLNYHENAN